MARRRRDVVTGMVCVGAFILLVGVGALVYQMGPTFTMEVCSKCGLLRKRTVWRIPRTSTGLYWRSSDTKSAVSSALHDHGLVDEWKHRWVVYNETRPAPPPPATPA